MWRRPALFRCPCEDTDVEVKLREYRLQPRTVKGEDDEGNSISSTMAVKELTEVMVTGSELLTKIEAAATEYFTHCWNCRWANTARLNDMHKFTDTELFIQTDFAAQISNAAQDNLCCTHRNHTNLDVFVVASDPRLVDVTVKHADGSSSFVKKRITDNHAWKFYAGASGKGKDNDYFFHHAALTHLVDFYVAKRVKDNKPPLTRIDAKTSKSRRSTLSLDKYFYRFITWTQDDPIGVDDDDVFFADKSAKWSASPGLAEKDARLAALAPKIRKGDVVALGISQSERDAQGVDFYLAKVVVPPARADNQRRVNGSGRDGWNIKKGEFCLTVRWFDLKPCGYYEDYGSQDEQLLEMVIASATRALVLEPAPRKGRARGAPAQFQLAKASEAAIHNENLDKYVDRAAAGSSA
ncbi:hypothetical protein SO694_00037156 [Aureococcus anophagefferens]|uniref:Uncharacterized protein n=1 Tax=Aureococcus anophagefferens TaxID=44056 RepID=A0ABR1FKY6_AURAN